MEKCSVQLEDRKLTEGISLSDAEVHLLIEFLQLLDQWDRELRQNGSARSEVTVCRVQ